MKTKPNLSLFERDRIIFFHKKGYSSSQIKNELGFCSSTINYTIKRFKETGAVFDRFRSGRPSISTERDDRRLIHLNKKNRKASSSTLSNNWYLSSGAKASSRTVRRRLQSQKVKNRKQELHNISKQIYL